MKALLRQLQNEQALSRHLADMGARWGVVLKEDLTPQNLNKAQEWLAGRIRETEERIRTVRDRRRRRGRLLRPRLVRKPSLRRWLGRHQLLLQVREELLQRRRAMLRHIGDAVAWLVCRSEPRILFALFDASKTHHMPTGVGAIGHRFVRRRAHEDGRFLVVENDLTRCLGRGDMTMIPLEADRFRFYPIELKTHGQAQVGSHAYTHVHFMLAEDDHEDQKYADAFADAIGLERQADDQPSETIRRQRKEISRGRRTAHRLLTRLTARVSIPPPQNNLESIRTVLNRALRDGIGYDVPERGVGYGAVRSGAMDPESADRKLENPMSRFGLGRESDRVTIMSTTSLLSVDELSVNVRPIALWNLPVEHRARLLSGEIVLQVRHDATILKEIMEERGVAARFVEDQPRWEFNVPGGPTVAFDEVGMARLTARIMFEGVSPRTFADRLVQEFRGEEPEAE